MKHTLLTLMLKGDRLFTRSGFLLLAASLLAGASIAVPFLTMSGSAAPPPACAFSDDLEPTQDAGWAFEVAQNNLPASQTWALAVDGGAHSPTHSFTSDATANDIKDDRLISPPLNLSVTSTLSFWHKFAFEDGFDGGLLEVSVDGGAWTEIAPAAFTAGGYNGTIDSGFDSPIAGRNAWTGTSSSFPTMDNVVVSLAAFAGSNVRIRWRLGLDNGVLVPGAGWWIDDISITDACPGATPSASPSPSPSPSVSPSPTPPGVDLSIVATASDGTVNANETYIDVIKVKNSAASNATNVQVQIVLAPGAVYLGTPTTPDPASGTGTAADPLIWNLGTLTPGAETRIYLYQRAKSEAEDNTIVWQLLDTKATVSFTLSGNADKRQDQTLGPKVVPAGDVGDTVRHGKRPFPVAYVEYTDMKHTRPDSIFLGFFDSLITRYLEMSMNQLLPEPSMPSLGRTVTFASTPAERYRFSTTQPAGFCGGATLGEDTDPYDDDTPPPAMTNRIENGWYQLPGTRGYYGSDSTVSAYPAFFVPVGLLLNIDNGCGPPGKIAYDAATLMDPDVDYNDFDTDRDGWVDFFELVYQGQPQNILGQTGADNVWPHSSGLQYYYKDGYTSHDRLRDHQDRLLFWTDDTHTATTLTDTGKPAFVRVGAYNVNAEFSDEITFAHEYGHSLGLPDEYTTAGRNTIDDWSLMSSGPGHMGIWDKQELGWIVPALLASPLNVTAQKELKVDTHQIEWRDSNGSPYTLTGNVHNAEVYKVELPKVQLFDPSLIPSGSWVYYSQAGNGFGYPGHVFDIAFDANTTAGSSSLKLQFKSWFEIEKDYDYAYLQVCQLRGTPLSLQCDNLESINDAAEGGPTTGVADTNPNGTNKGNGMTCSSGSTDDPSCGVAAYPEPEFITDEFDLTPYIGEDFLIRWAYSTDPGLAFRGWVIDDIELLQNGTTRIFFDDVEDPILSNDDTHAYNGWLRSNGTATQEHAYWIGVRDKTGFDAACAWDPGVTLEYANEAHGYGNSGVDDPPAYTVLDSHPQAGASDVNLNDAAWKPFASDPGNLTANNGDVFTDCDDPAYADGPRHVDNYEDPNSADGNWHFGWRKLKLLVNSTAGAGTFGTMTASVNYTLPAPCTNATPTPTPTPSPKPSPSPSPSPSPATAVFMFDNIAYQVQEDVTSITVRVLRTGATNTQASVDIVSNDGTAKQKGDFELVVSRLVFAAGETEKLVKVLINEDGYSEGPESANLLLQNPTNGTLGTPSAATLQITDDVSESASNPIDDSRIFVGTHYHDFLYRQSDQSGEDFWTNGIESCGSNAQCRQVKRIDTSTAFFLSIEFKETGYFVLRAHKSGFGSAKSNPRYAVFLRDQRQITNGVIVGDGNWRQQLTDNKAAYLADFVSRSEFTSQAEFAPGAPAATYVDKLFANNGVTPTTAERNAAISAYGSGDAAGRTAALGSVIESGSVFNAQYNPGFVLMQYYGYLRRNPDDAPDNNFVGYDFWLAKLNSFSQPGEDMRDDAQANLRAQRAEMVKAFIESTEYRHRFFGAPQGNQAGPDSGLAQGLTDYGRTLMRDVVLGGLKV